MDKALVFIIDDQEDILSMLSEYLSEKFGFNCEGFTSLDDALSKIDEGQIPSLILADVFMITGSGLRLNNELEKRSLEVPRIFISGLMDKLPNKEGYIILKKPIIFEDLDAHIKKLI